MAEHIRWQDVIQIHRSDDELKSQTPQQLERYYERMEQFLDFVETTPQGQEMLKALQEKYAGRSAEDGGPKVGIFLNDNLASMVLPNNGNVTVAIGDMKLGFLDKESGQVKNYSLERIMFHELTHAADKNKKLNVVYVDQNSEEYATQKTDEFARNHMPELGQRVVYNNSFGERAIPSLGLEGVDGKEKWNNNAELRQKIGRILSAPPPVIDRNKPYLINRQPYELEELGPQIDQSNSEQPDHSDITSQEQLPTLKF